MSLSEVLLLLFVLGCGCCACACNAVLEEDYLGAGGISSGEQLGSGGGATDGAKRGGEQLGRGADVRSHPPGEA
jgi:hypothetical protein